MSAAGNVARSLDRRRILVTRGGRQAEETILQLRRWGAEPVHVPLVQIVPVVDGDVLVSTLQRLSARDWVVFTSVNAVTTVFSALTARESALEALRRARVAAVGTGTAEALLQRDIHPQLVPRRYRWQELAEALLARADQGARVLLPRSSRAGAQLPAALRAGRLQVEEIVTYDTRVEAQNIPRVVQLLTEKRLDAVILTSASAVGAFARAWREVAAGASGGRPLLAYIGPNTAEAARQHGLPVDVVPETARVSALIEALATSLGPTGATGPRPR